MRLSDVRKTTILLVATVSSLCFGQVDRRGALPPDLRNANRHDQRKIAGVDLYKRPDPDAGLTEAQKAIKRSHPVLMAPEAVIVIWGADWCHWCKKQAEHLQYISRTYNVVYYEIEKDGEDTKHKALFKLLGLEGSSLPVTTVLEKGKITKTFVGFTRWQTMKPFAEKARKDEKDTPDNLKIGPLNIDWSDGLRIDFDRNRRR